MSEHQHQWRLSAGSVIDTLPPEYPYDCACGAFTHDPETGEPCSVCDPVDWEQRTTNLVTLHGGDFDGTTVAKPNNRKVYWRLDPPDKLSQRIAIYQQTEDKAIWEFVGYVWSKPPPTQRETP